MRTKYLSVKEAEGLELAQYPNFASNGSIAGMRKLYYGKHALLVKSGSYIYNVTSNPSIYNQAH